jgi:hypothetical protein
MEAALDDFRKANKQDGGQCWECLIRAYNLAIKTGAYKDAMTLRRTGCRLAQTDAEGCGSLPAGDGPAGTGHQRQEETRIQESCGEFKTALYARPIVGRSAFGLGRRWPICTRTMRRARSLKRSSTRPEESVPARARGALCGRIDLARATMAPPFPLTTLDGQRISMDSLAGKVVLIDFWATWCGPCREALPHMQRLRTSFDGQPLVVLSISLDATKPSGRTLSTRTR